MPKKIPVEHVGNKEEKKVQKEKQEDVNALKKKIRKKESEIRELKEKLETLKGDYLRQMADKENLRKRLEREKQEYYQYALSDLLKELLGVLDNFERALSSEDPESNQSFKEGIEMISKQFQNLLIRQGIKPISIEDKTFNPHLHQAFITEESEEVDEPKVTQELQKGYTLHERLLRPALVKVIVPKKEE